MIETASLKVCWACSAEWVATAALTSLTAFLTLVLELLFLTLLTSFCLALLRADGWFAKFGSPLKSGVMASTHLVKRQVGFVK